MRCVTALTRPSNQANSGYSGMTLKRPSSPRYWNSRSCSEIIALAPSMTFGSGPSNVRSLTMLNLRPVSILLPSRRTTRTLAQGMNCVGCFAKSRTPALVRCPSTSMLRLRRTCSSETSVPSSSL